tara:strand:+ start:544 stop:1419 length:876 start_codon:yes stop_codon:yes gene_type:complete
MRIVKLLVVCFLFVQVLVAQKETPVKKVFFFAGQSNMDGRADADKISDKDFKRLEAVKDRVQFYYNNQAVTPLQITTSSKGTQKKFNFTHAFGPELFFGIELAEKYHNEEFIFIKRAKGGTSLYGAWNPNWNEAMAEKMNELKVPKLYFDFVKYSHSVLDDLNSKSYEICGMLWVQGETDSGKKRGPEPAEAYEENLTLLINSVRKEFKVKEMPFLIFQVGNGKVVQGMKNIATSDKNVELITQSNNKKAENYYPKNPAPLGHYVTESMKRIGVEFSNEYQTSFAAQYLSK